MPSSLKLFRLLFVPLLPPSESPLQLGCSCRKLPSTTVFSHPSTGWTEHGAVSGPRQLSGRKQMQSWVTLMLKKQPPSVPTTSLPGLCSPDVVLSECYIAAHQAPSEAGSGQGQAEQSWSVAELCGGALQHLTSPRL